MAVVTFSKPVAFPIAPLRDMLAKYVPLFRWQCGEDDTGDPRQMGTYSEHGIISGRSDGSIIFTEYRARLAQFPGAPRHEWYLELFAPTTELQPIAERITAVICAIVMIPDEHDAHCQLVPGGPWLRAAAMPGVLRALTGSASLIDAVAAAGVAAPAAAVSPRGSAETARMYGSQVNRDAAAKGMRLLPHLLLLVDRVPRFDDADLLRVVTELDPDGGWRLDRMNGQIALIGRGTVLGVLDFDDTVPPGMIADSWPRSWWFEGDKNALEQHRRHLCVSAALDTAKADWVDVRQVAKVMTLIAAWLARLPGVLALHNTGPGITFAASEASRFLGILARDQLPVMLWSWVKPHSMTDGDVTLSTSGLAPLLGHEIEVWNAPLHGDEVRDKVSNLIIHLLDAGPVIGHGDSAGRTAGDRSIRCFLGPARAERPVPVQALFLEFEGPDVPTAPKPDLPEAPEPPMSAGTEGVLRDFLRTVGGRDTIGMSDVIRGMLDENEAAKDVTRAVDGPPVTPELAEADRLLRLLKQDADGTSAEAIEALQGLMRAPPSPKVVASGDNPVFTNLMKLIHHEQATGALPTPDGVLPDGHIAVLLLQRGVGLPVRELCDQLVQAFPERRWTVSASSRGLNEPRTVTGTGTGPAIIARIVASTEPCPEPGTPPHAGHVVVSVAAPDANIARGVATIVLGCLMLGQDRGALGCIGAGAPWIDYDELVNHMVAVKHSRRAAVQQPQVAAGFGRRVGGFGRKGL